MIFLCRRRCVPIYHYSRHRLKTAAQLGPQNTSRDRPRDVREMYDARTAIPRQNTERRRRLVRWRDGPGVTRLDGASWPFSPPGEDPTSPLQKQIRKAVKNIVQGQNARTGLLRA